LRYERPKYEFPIDWQDWCTGAGQPAGIWWLDGRTYFAGLGSLAEARLSEAGAFHVATLQFAADPLEARHPGATVAPVAPFTMLQQLGALA
jgi:hypothetical protein